MDSRMERFFTLVESDRGLYGPNRPELLEFIPGGVQGASENVKDRLLLIMVLSRAEYLCNLQGLYSLAFGASELGQASTLNLALPRDAFVEEIRERVANVLDEMHKALAGRAAETARAGRGL